MAGGSEKVQKCADVINIGMGLMVPANIFFFIYRSRK
jgi:hypothetical protein